MTSARNTREGRTDRRRLAARIVPALAAAALFLPPSAAGGDSPWKEAPLKSSLSTGQVCLFQRDLSSRTTVVQLLVPGGKNAVPAGKDGLACLTTRLTLEIPDDLAAQDIMGQATRMRVSIFEDYSVISLECLSENLEDALRVAGDIIQSPLISGPRIDNNKTILSISAKAEADDAVETGHAAALAAYFRGQGYGSAVYGNEASLKAIGKKDITSFYNRFFVRPAVIFSVCSDLPREKVLPLLEKSFGRFPARPAETPPPGQPSLPENRQIILEREAKQAYVGRAFLLPPASPADYARGLLLEVLLGVGPGSRLWELRAAERLAYTVGARVTWMKGPALLEVYLETADEKRDKAVAALDAILTKLHDTGLAADELAMTKALARASLLRSLEAKRTRAQMMGQWEMLGLGLDAFIGVFDGLEAVRLEEMNAFIRDQLGFDKSLLVIVRGKSGS